LVSFSFLQRQFATYPELVEGCRLALVLSLTFIKMPFHADVAGVDINARAKSKKEPALKQSEGTINRLIVDRKLYSSFPSTTLRTCFDLA